MNVTNRVHRKVWLSGRMVAAFLSSHSVLGLAVAALIYLICLTGTIAVFAPEIGRWEQPSAPRVTVASDATVEKGLVAIRDKLPAAAVRSISAVLPSDTMPRLTLTAGGVHGRGGESWFADSSGLPKLQVRHDAIDMIAALHARLLLPDIAGMTVVGFCGLALLALVLTGVLAHPRMIKDAFRLRRGGSELLQEADLHNRLGTWALPFHLMISFSGAALGVSFIVLGSVAATTYRGDLMRAFSELVGPSVAEDRTAALLPPLSPMLASVRSLAPNGALAAVQIDRPGTRGASFEFDIRNPRSILRDDHVLFDGRGHRLFSTDATHRSVSQKAVLAMQPLHFGRFGGAWLTLSYGLAGLSLCVVTASGVRLWLARQRQKGKPAPAWERLWTATLWGQPLALVVAAWMPLAFKAHDAPAYGWILMISVAYFIGCLPIANAKLSAGLRGGLAFLLIFLVVSHAAIWFGSNNDGTSWSIDALLVCIALTILASIRRVTLHA